MPLCASSYRRPASRSGTSRSQSSSFSNSLKRTFSFDSISRTLSLKHKTLGRGKRKDLTLTTPQDPTFLVSFADLSESSRDLYAQILRHNVGKHTSEKDYHRLTNALISHLDRHLRDTRGGRIFKHCHLHARLHGNVTASVRSCFETYAKIHLRGLLQRISSAAKNKFSSKTSRCIKLIEDTLGLTQVPQKWSEAFRRTFPHRYRSVNTSCDACYLTAISNSPRTLAAFRSIVLASSKAGLVIDTTLTSRTIQWIDAWFSTYDSSVASSMIDEAEAIAFDIEKAILLTVAGNMRHSARHSQAQIHPGSNMQRSATESKRPSPRSRCRGYTMPKAVVQDALEAYQCRAYLYHESGISQEILSDIMPASLGTRSPSSWRHATKRCDTAPKASASSVRHVKHQRNTVPKASAKSVWHIKHQRPSPISSPCMDPVSGARSAAGKSTVTATQVRMHGPWSMLYLSGRLPFPHSSQDSLRAEGDNTVENINEQARPILAN